MKKTLLSLMLGAVLVLGACGGNKAAPTTTAPATGGQTAAIDAEKIVNAKCITCHGGNLEGRGNAPALANVGSHLSETEIRDVILNGKPPMPPGIIKGEEADAVAKWLAEKK